MFDIEAFTPNRDYFDTLDESRPFDPDDDLTRNAEVLDRIDRELEASKND